MFERLQKPFLTVETGEAYQPVRLTYQILQKDKLIAALKKIHCLIPKNENAWTWHWDHECTDLHFESLDSFKKNPEHPLRLGTFTIRDNMLYLNLPSFKRACMGAPFFFKLIDSTIVKISKADFINKVFGLSERLPHGFSELFNEEELEKIVYQRIHDYETVKERVEQAPNAKEAFSILSEYTKTESEKRLPYTERYAFEYHEKLGTDPDVMFLGFYIFLRGRELVAIRRWFGETGFTLSDAAEETVEQIFGGMHIDIIE